MPITHLPITLKLYKTNKPSGPPIDPKLIEEWNSERLAKAPDGTDAVYHALCQAFNAQTFAEKVDKESKFYITDRYTIIPRSLWPSTFRFVGTL